MKTIERNTKSTLLQRKSTWSLLSFFLLALFLAAPMQAQVSKKDLRASQKEVARLESDYAKLSKQMQKIEKTIQKLDAQINNEQAKLNRIAQEGAELEPKRAAAVKKRSR